MTAALIAGLFEAEVAVCIATPAMHHGGLFPDEAAIIARAVAKRREEFTAGRRAARIALARLGLPPAPLLQTSRRAPAWPQGVAGSITHCQGFCCAVVAPSARVQSLGIDAEARGALPDQLAAMICRPAELAHFAQLPDLQADDWPKLAFSAKEAFYKCVDPMLGEFLDFHDAAVRFGTDPAGGSGGFAITVVKPGLAAPGLPASGRWAIDDGRVYAGVTWAAG